jgi:hypothetical protein
MSVNTVAVLGVRRSERTFLLAKTAQQVKSRTLIRESLAFAASAAGFITWGTLLILLAG